MWPSAWCFLICFKGPAAHVQCQVIPSQGDHQKCSSSILALQSPPPTPPWANAEVHNSELVWKLLAGLIDDKLCTCWMQRASGSVSTHTWSEPHSGTRDAFRLTFFVDWGEWPRGPSTDPWPYWIFTWPVFGVLELRNLSDPDGMSSYIILLSTRTCLILQLYITRKESIFKHRLDTGLASLENQLCFCKTKSLGQHWLRRDEMPGIQWPNLMKSTVEYLRYHQISQLLSALPFVFL